MRVVMKFGGSSVGSGERIKNTAELVKDHKPEECVVVVSAMHGVTDRLVDMAERVALGMPEEMIKDFTGELREKHRAATYEAVSRGYRETVMVDIERLCAELEKVLVGVSMWGS
jgi:aspartate kinase